MNDRQFRHEVARIRKYTLKWTKLLGMDHWAYDVQVALATLPGADGSIDESFQITAATEVRWEYSAGRTTYSALATCCMDDSSLEETVIHEMLHCLVAELRSEEDTWSHEEHVVSHLARRIQIIGRAQEEIAKTKRSRPLDTQVPGAGSEEPREEAYAGQGA